MPSADLLDERLHEALVTARAPLKLAALRKALGKPAPPTAAVTEALERMAADGRVHRLGTSWSAEDPRAVAAAALRAIVAEAPSGITPAKLKAALKSRAAAVASAYAAALDDLLARGEVHAHFGWSATGKRGTRPAFYAADPEPPPSADVFLAKARAPVRAAADAALACGVGACSLADAVRRLAASDRALVEEALHRLAARERPGALLSLNDLRLSVSLDKPSFDRAVLALRHDGHVSLFQHDDPGSLGRVERSALVADPSGTHYVGVALREDS